MHVGLHLGLGGEAADRRLGLDDQVDAHVQPARGDVRGDEHTEAAVPECLHGLLTRGLVRARARARVRVRVGVGVRVRVRVRVRARARVSLARGLRDVAVQRARLELDGLRVDELVAVTLG